MGDPLEALIDAWVRWDDQPSSPTAVTAKQEALARLGLSGISAHNQIAAHRRAGYSIPDAIQSTVNTLQEAD